MPSLKDIKNKISSVQNTQKTTRAMKLVATSKLKKVEEMAKKSKAYNDKITQIISDIRYKIDKYGMDEFQNNYIKTSENKQLKTIDIICITADKGLCGGFNTITINQALQKIKEYEQKNIKVRLRCIGKKGISYFKFNNIDLISQIGDLSSYPDYKKGANFINEAIKDYSDGITDKIILIHNGFKNMISQELKVLNLLPVDIQRQQKEDKSQSIIDVEPQDNDSLVISELAKKYVENALYFSLIDSLAAEYSARMQAMDAATNNAAELVNNLTILYNKERQAAITTELVEINTGAEAMK